jgi:hypothetical protein
MRLRVPAAQVDDMLAALDARRIRIRIGNRRVAEQLQVTGPLVQLVSLVDGMPGLMAKNASGFALAGSFHLEHLAAFEPHEPGMGKVEGYCETKHAVGVEEFLRQIHVRQRRDVTRPQFAMQPLHPAVQQRAVDADRQVAQARRQQFLVVDLVQDQRRSG